MHRYFKVYTESLEGEIAECSIEVGSDDVITKQVLVFGGKGYWATSDSYADERHLFTDQPEVDMEADDLTPIEARAVKILSRTENAEKLRLF